MMTYPDFHDKSGVYDDKMRFLWWQVEIFMMIGRGFHDDR